MKKTFTLVEILVSATIIAILTGTVAVSYAQLNKQSRDAKRKADLEQIRAALEMYRNNNNQYYSGTFNNNCQNITWLNNYLSSIPNDPKSSNGYYYRCVISQSNYTIATYLESGDSSCGESQFLNCGTGSVYCNYCVGPYGKK